MNIGVSILLTLLTLLKDCSPIKWRLEPQPNDVDRGSYDEPRPDDGHICLRECERGDIARICYYKFHLEEYTVFNSACGDCPQNSSDCLNPECVTADAYQQPILTVNRMLPGPSIQVCKGDTIVVDVVNNIPDSNVTIHWHGVKHFGAPGTPWMDGVCKGDTIVVDVVNHIPDSNLTIHWHGVKHFGAPGTPWMDGVPYLTQCPVLYNQTFQYHFVPGESGTFLWHSYDGDKQLQGLVGSLIVREPYSSDSLRLWYDYDLPSHVILVQDWVHNWVEDNSIAVMLKNMLGQVEDEEDSTSKLPDVFLINGRGVETTFHKPKQTPISEFYVHHGFRYRFRVVGGTSLTCPFQLTIQGHQLLIISADSNPIKPVLVDSLVVSSGERYDVVLNATQPVCSYWVLVEGVGACKSVSQAALLRYHGCTLDNITQPDALARGLSSAVDRYTLNPVNGECSKTSLHLGICASQLMSPLPNHLRLSRQPDFRYLVKLDPTSTDEGLSFSLYSSLDLTPAMPNETTEILVPLNAVFEVLMINTRTDNMSKSCHLHGHDFYIVEQGQLPDPFLSTSLHDLQFRLADNRRFASRLMPSKDTVAVPDSGYALVRVLADNPGFWLLSCRGDPDITAVIQVGQFFDIPALPADFPACEGFMHVDLTDLPTM